MDWGRPTALDDLIPHIYRELHHLAHRRLSRERRDHTLQTTALVNEVYLLLAGHRRPRWKDKAHFFAICAHLVRRVLVDYARHKKRAKRGGGVEPLLLEDAMVMSEERSSELVRLDEALSRLREIDPRKHQVVELRYFGGLTSEQVAEVLHISSTTVMRDWKLGKTWLRREMSEP